MSIRSKLTITFSLAEEAELVSMYINLSINGDNDVAPAILEREDG